MHPAQSMLSAIPEEAECSFPDRLAVKPNTAHRGRAMTDSELWLNADSASQISDVSTDLPSSDEDDQHALSLQGLGQFQSPSWGPADDAFYLPNTADKVLSPLLPPHLMPPAGLAPPSFLPEDGCPWGLMPDDAAWASLYQNLPEALLTLSPEDFMGMQQGLEKPMTTVMLRNLPPMFTRSSLIEVLEDEGFEGSYDLVYVPMDFSRHCCLGYAFVNFMTGSDAARCWEAFQGFSEWGAACESPCEVVWSDPHQGIEALIERYRNSPVMHESVPEEWKPAYFVDGALFPFPEPTEKIKAPKQKTSRVKAKKDQR